MPEKRGGTEIAGRINFRRANYWADGRGRKSKFKSAEKKKRLTVDEAAGLVQGFMNEMGGSDTCLVFVGGTVTCDRMAARWDAKEKSDILLEKDPPFTAGEFDSFRMIIREKRAGRSQG